MPCDLSPILRPTSSLRFGWVERTLLSARGREATAADRTPHDSGEGFKIGLPTWKIDESVGTRLLVESGHESGKRRAPGLDSNFRSPVTITDGPALGYQAQPLPANLLRGRWKFCSLSIRLRGETEGQEAPRDAGSYKLLNTWPLRRFDLGFSSSLLLFLLRYWLLLLACCRRRRFRLQIRPLRCPLRSRCWT